MNSMYEKAGHLYFNECSPKSKKTLLTKLKNEVYFNAKCYVFRAIPVIVFVIAHFGGK